MKLKYDVYLAGSMNGRLGRDVLDERHQAKQICKKLGLTYYDPAGDEVINPNAIIDTAMTRAKMAFFVRKDFRNLDRCRILVHLTGDKSSSGSAWEMGRTYYKLRRPIVLVAPRMYDKRNTNFTTILATKICPTQLTALRWAKRKLK